MSETTNQKENNDSNSTKHKPKRLVLIIAIVLGLIGLILGISYYIHSFYYESTDDAFIDGHIIQISPKVSGNIKKLHITDNQYVNKGSLLVEIDPKDYKVRLEQAQAILQATIAKQKLANINVDLTQITSVAGVEQANSSISSYKSAVQTAKDQIGLNKSMVEQTKAQYMATRADLERVKSQITSTKAQLKLAEDDYKRYQELFNQKLISKQQIDNSLVNLTIAKSNLEELLKTKTKTEFEIKAALAAKETSEKTLKQSRSRLNEATGQLGVAVGKFNQVNTVSQQLAVSKYERDQATAQIKQLYAAVKQAELELSYTKLYAPASGRITRRAIEEGAFVQIGQPFFAIVPDKVWVTANFKENQIRDMKPGQAVNISVDTYKPKVFKGHVDSIQRGTGARFSLIPPENAVGSYVKIVQRVPVKIMFDESFSSHYLLAPGMSVVPEVKVR